MNNETNEDKQHFLLSDELANDLIQPLAEDQMEECKNKFNKSFFAQKILIRHSNQESGVFRVCDDGEISDELLKFLFKRFFPEVGIIPSRDTAQLMNEKIRSIISELFAYYKVNTDHFGDRGKVFMKEGMLYYEVFKYKRSDVYEVKKCTVEKKFF